MTPLEAKEILEAYTGQLSRYIGYTDEDGFCFECNQGIHFVTPDCCIWGPAGGLLHEDLDARRELEASAEYFREKVDQDDPDEARARRRDYDQQWSDFLTHIGYNHMR